MIGDIKKQLTRSAESLAGHWGLRTERETMRAAFIPEGPEQELIASFSGIGDEVQEKGHEDLERERAATRKVVLAHTVGRRVIRVEELRKSFN